MYLFFRYVYTYARPKKEKDSDDEESSDEEDEEDKGEWEYQRKIWAISRLRVGGLEQQIHSQLKEIFVANLSALLQ